MKRTSFSPPEPFSLSPLLSLLPSMGQLGKLESFTASLYARYEKVQAMRKEAVESGSTEFQRKMFTEEAMLKQALDWLRTGIEF